MNLRTNFNYALLFTLLIIIMIVFTQNVDGFLISIDDKQVNFTDDMGHPYITEEERTMVPLRIITEEMGYDVSWEQETKTATIVNGADTIKVTIGKNVAMKNGKQVYIDIQDGKPVNTKAVLFNDRTYVPLRFITENTGGKVVSYDQVMIGLKKVHKIVITTGVVVPPAPAPTPGTDPTFDPVSDVRDDGRLTKEKTTEYIEKMIEGTTLKKENGKYILEFERPAIAEGFETAITMKVLSNSGSNNQIFTTGKIYGIEEKLPSNQSFKKEIVFKDINDVKFINFYLSVYEPTLGASMSYEVWYWPDSGKAESVYTNEFGAQGKYSDFDKSRLFEGL